MQRIIRVSEAAQMLGVAKSTLHRWRQSDPTFPTPIRLGKNSTGFRVADLERWIDQREEASRQADAKKRRNDGKWA